MNDHQGAPIAPAAKGPVTLSTLALWGAPFVMGAAATFGFMQWSAQQRQLVMLTEMVVQMQQAPQAVAPVAAEAEAVTRTTTMDLTAVPVAQVVAAPVAPLSTADKIRELTAASNVGGGLVQAPQDSSVERRALRMETLAIIDAGVQELVSAVVAGAYDIHTNYQDEHFAGRIHFAFIGYEDDQAELEQFIAAAAEDGLIAHGPAVVDADGSINGHIMLFDLVERALESGTLAEQRAGAEMQRKAVEMLNADVTVGEAPDASGDRYYTVEPGDSLAYIALQFYGNTNDFNRIFVANRNILSSPERINVGQRLLIPEA